MENDLLLPLMWVVVLAVGAQWLAWRLRAPSILLLLVFGFLAGPVAHWIDPDKMFGDLLFAFVSLSVGVILFEGGLNLRFGDLTGGAAMVWRLVSIGLAVTWLIGALAAWQLAGLPWPLALLAGAILVVSGPTVIMPLLRQVRPTGPAGQILKWEGILIDPIGAMLAVLVFEALFAGAGEGHAAGWLPAAAGMIKTVIAGGVIGVVAAIVMVFVLRRYWLPDYLESPLTLMVVVAAFGLANTVQAESGLLAAPVMGLAMANQRAVSVHHILKFKENLGVLLIGCLFILLAARLQIDDLAAYGLGSLAVAAVLILAARPLAVLASTTGSKLQWSQRALLASVAPRGIVAAAVASVFAFRLEAAGYAEAAQIVPLTFVVIVATIAVYGLGAGPVARRLGLSRADPQGLLIVGAHDWARALAVVLKEKGFDVLLIDTNLANVRAARMEDLVCLHGDALSEEVEDDVATAALGRMLALTGNDQANALAALHYRDQFGRSGTYRLPSNEQAEAQLKGERTGRTQYQARTLFAPTATFEVLASRFAAGARIKATPLTEQFDYQALEAHYGGTVLPMCVIDDEARLHVLTADSPRQFKPNQTLICMVDEPSAPNSTATGS